MRSILRHLRKQPVAYLALFTSLSGSAVAVQAIDGRLLIDKSIDQTKVNETIQKRKPEAPPVCESGYIKSMTADGGVICGDAISKSTDAEKLGGKSPEEYLLKLEKAKQAENADTLGGKTKDDFLGKLEKAQEAVKADLLGDKTKDDFLGKLEKAQEAVKADKLGDKTADDFLGKTEKAESAKDADRLGGKPASGFPTVVYRNTSHNLGDPPPVAAHSCRDGLNFVEGVRATDIISANPREVAPDTILFLEAFDGGMNIHLCNMGISTQDPEPLRASILILR